MRSLWARITGGDKGLKYPQQQTSSLSSVGDVIVITPYGLYCDLPDETLVKLIDKNAGIPITVARPEDVERGEPVFYHPVTGTRIIARNNGDLDIEIEQVEGANGNVNIICNQANVTAADTVNVTAATSVNIDAPITNLGVGGNEIARLGDAVEVTVTGGSSAGTYSGTITSAGVNTSI